jgi:hypothetical protein
MFSLYFYSSAILPDSLFGFGSEGLNHSFIVLPEEHCWLMFQAMFPQWQALLINKPDAYIDHLKQILTPSSNFKSSLGYYAARTRRTYFVTTA